MDGSDLLLRPLGTRDGRASRRHDQLGRKGSDSVRISLHDVIAWSPEILIVMPCGFGLEKAAEQTSQFLQSLPDADAIPAVRHGRIFAVDANSYFARPGPRVTDGIELLAHLLHPQLFDWHGPNEAFRNIAPSSVVWELIPPLCPAQRCVRNALPISCAGPAATANHAGAKTSRH